MERAAAAAAQSGFDRPAADVGWVWAGGLSVLHSAIGQCVHLRGRPWLYYIYDPKQHRGFALRRDVFGFSNDTGLLAALVVIALLATSNDYFLCRRWAGRGWKRLQRWNYAAFALGQRRMPCWDTSSEPEGEGRGRSSTWRCMRASGVTVGMQGAADLCGGGTWRGDDRSGPCVRSVATRKAYKA